MERLKAVSILCAVLAAFISNTEAETRIVNGQNSQRGQFPHQALLIIRYQAFDQLGRCGGCLISNRWVLTAAHCVDGAAVINVHLGALYTHNTKEEGRVIRNTNKFHIHPRYFHIGFENDIALVNLMQPVKLSPTIQPARLPNRTSYEGATALMSGFGLKNSSNRQFPTIMQWAPFRILTNAQCARRFGSNGRRVQQPIFICADGLQGQTRCYGDSGSPLITKERAVIGIVGFGDPQDCRPGLPSVCTRVSEYLDWIDIVLRNK